MKTDYFFEIVLFLTPIVLIVLFKTKLSWVTKTIYDQLGLNLSFILLPVWFSVIYCFSHLLFDVSIVPWLIFISSAFLIYFLLEYIKPIKVFRARDFIDKSSRLLFVLTSAFMLSIMIVRVISYFK